MNLLLQLLVLFLAFINPKHEAMAQNLPPYTSIVAPITKHNDTATPLYSVPIMSSNIDPKVFTVNYLIDIDAPIVWNYCTVEWTDHDFYQYPRYLDPDECTAMQTTYSYHSPSCPPLTKGSTPGLGYYDCVVNVVSPVDGTCSQAGLNEDTFFMVNISDGRNPFPYFSDDGLVYPACVPSSIFEAFPANVKGVMALSASPYSYFPSFFQPRKSSLALCLPRSFSVPGVLFIGTGPYYLLPNSDLDVRSLLSYTPLLNHQDSFGYFIGVESILIKGRSIEISSGVSNTTKLSTIQPYTTLRTNIYNQLVNFFSIATMGIPRATPVAPFGLCFKNRSIGNDQVDLRVPDIVLRLQDGKKWNISTTNSMKQITEDVACLAFVDGGATSEHAIVIGTFQLEDNFLLFDRENSTLGFSSSLLKKGTSCSNFNFTTASV